ncbi:MAG TPA: hypothetical protein VIM76_07940 [Candidatus Dormibacteraeota bacterium]|jgi:hypothetical protein
MLIDDLRRSVTHILQCFLDFAIESQFVILENGDAADEFIQLKLNQRVLYGEVGSREWDVFDARRPLSAEARALLAGLGFTHGGPERNYICDDLAQSAPYSADLYLRLHSGAYGSPPTSVSVITDVQAVRALAGPSGRSPKASPFAPDGGRHEKRRTTHVETGPGLKFRVERALRSNFAEIGSTSDELEALRREVEQSGSWEALPEWARDWIRKAEEGPLWVVLGR